MGLVAIIIYQQGLHIADLQALGMGLSNTFGLSVGILLMGYGLVEIPRHMWKSDPEQLLKWCAHRCARARRACVCVCVAARALAMDGDARKSGQGRVVSARCRRRHHALPWLLRCAHAPRHAAPRLPWKAEGD